MGRAAQQRDAAERRAEAARQAAGLTHATSGLSVALKAMRENADRDLAQAESANAKAKLLAPTRPEKDDPHIAAAMNAVTGSGAPQGSLSDRWPRCAGGAATRRACRRRRRSEQRPRTAPRGSPFVVKDRSGWRRR
jgi:hypothetical protein